MTNLTRLIGNIAKQVLNEQNKKPSNNSLTSLLGSVLGGLNQSNTSQAQSTQQATGLNSILGSALSGLIAKKVGGVKGMLLIAVISFILNWIQQQGGFEQALNTLRDRGLNDHVNHWVDPNQTNLPMTTQNVQSLFNDQEIEHIAQQNNVSKQDVYNSISDILPQIIDALTPQGTQTNPQEVNNDIQNVLKTVTNYLKR